MHASEDALDASELEQYGPTDLSPTESSLHLLGLNRTEPSAREDGSEVVRIVGGRDCAEGECPWQVTAGLGGQVAGAGGSISKPACVVGGPRDPCESRKVSAC